MLSRRGRSILIVGDGIGGTATALACAAKAGIRSTLIGPAREEGPDYWIGLWRPAIERLKLLGIIDDERIQREGVFMKGAGYRSGYRGDWLARPSRPLNERERSLFFVRESTLLSALRRHVSRIPSIDYVEDMVVNAKRADGRYALEVESGETIEPGDVLVLADGTRSKTRDLLDVPNMMRYRGYHVYRGISRFDSTDRSSFQSWGPGARFACVPVGPDQQMWFATQVRDEATAEELDGARDRGADVLEDAKRLLRGWHDPIEKMLDRTDPNTVVRQAAVETYGDSRSESGDFGLYRVGDCARCLDPIMAVGAGLAVVDAFVVARTVAFDDDGDGAFAAQDSYVRDLRRLSDMSQRFGQIESPLLCSFRDAIMRSAPGKAKSIVFDWLMDIPTAARYDLGSLEPWR